MVRYGIIGFGLHAAKRLMPGFADARNCRVTALTRRDVQRAAESAREFGIDHAFTSTAELCASPDVDAVLMDIMMPEFDGLDTTRAIREIPDLKELPIIAVTAKAMKGDREKCIEAGAWDYLSKPVNPEQMLAVLRAWIRR